MRICLLFVILSLPVRAAVTLTARDLPLSDALRQTGLRFGIPVIVSPQVDDRYSGRLQAGSFGAALDALARGHALVWYLVDGVLHVYRSTEMVTAEISTPHAEPSGWIGRVSGLLDSRACKVNVQPTGRTVAVTGVPVCIERIRRLAANLDEAAALEDQNRPGVAVYPLRYANAADGTYQVRDQQVRVPGVVSILRDMLTGQGKEPAPGLAADARRNAVVIRDRPSRLPAYADLVARLDVRPALIDISVLIVDVDEGDLDLLGVEWRGQVATRGVGMTLNAGREGLSGVVRDTPAFLMQISALTARARARVLSRPSVVTLDNVQAVLDRNVTFYTRLASEKEASLGSVTTGSLLRVTPRIIEEHGEKRVMLNLQIRDGRQAPPLDGQDGLPQVTGSDIATQATLVPGQSLLLGGFIQEAEQAGERRIPWLGSLPLIGWLFRYSQKAGQRSVRLFLVKAEPVVLP